ncbi:MAG: 6-phosphogluconolactonase, partial [Jatrophihabitantaceae bacterium]
AERSDEQARYPHPRVERPGAHRTGGLTMMGADPEVIVEVSADTLAQRTAGRSVRTLVAALSERPVAHLVITGGGILEQVMRALRDAKDRDDIDWSRVHVWWGDERFVPSGSEDRNDLAADRALLDALSLNPAHVHRMPASDGSYGKDVDAAAAAYAAELAAVAEPGADVPAFDVVLLGLGPDGHCASLFPHHPSLQHQHTSVIGVRDSPKPPPTRISLTFNTLGAASEIWFIASGTAKSHAVAMALSGADRTDVPSAGPRGQQRTLWLIDREAETELAQMSGN